MRGKYHKRTKINELIFVWLMVKTGFDMVYVNAHFLSIVA